MGETSWIRDEKIKKLTPKEESDRRKKERINVTMTTWLTKKGNFRRIVYCNLECPWYIQWGYFINVDEGNAKAKLEYTTDTRNKIVRKWNDAMKDFTGGNNRRFGIGFLVAARSKNQLITFQPISERMLI